MHHSLSDGVDPRLLIRELRARFLPKIDVDTLARSVSAYLKTVSRPLPSDDVFARRLAIFLHRNLPTKTSEIRKLIENRPLELAALVERSDWDEHRKLTDIITKLPKPEEQRRQRRRSADRKGSKASAKRRYESLRPYHALSVGRIEREFNQPSSVLNPLARPLPPRLAFLDALLAGDKVKMRTLENWFGRDRKLLPPALRVVRCGRETYYDYRAFGACLGALLNDKSAVRCWPRDRAIRPRLVAGLITHIEEHASGEIKPTLLGSLMPHHTRV
jgi:hypothetical protein